MAFDFTPDESNTRHSRLGDSSDTGTAATQATNRFRDQLNQADSASTNINFARGASGEGRTIRVAFQDTPKPGDKATVDPAAVGEVKDEMRNAVGAYVKPGKYGPELIERKDKSRVVPKWTPSADGKTGHLAGFDEISPDGKQTRSWLREGDKFTSANPDGSKRVLRQVQFDSTNNGNITFTNEQGQSFIVRGNGAFLPTGPKTTQYKFDSQGRIESITPTLEAWNQGAPSMGFSYVGKTDRLQQIAERTKGQKASSTHLARPGEVLAENGDYKREETVKIAGKPTTVTRVHRPGAPPSTDDIQTQPFKQPDGSSSIVHFNTRGQFAGVDGFDKDGRLIKKYIMSPDRKQIAEIDPVAGNTTVWTNKEGEKWSGKQTRENGKVVDKDRGVRQKLDFTNLAELTYKDDKGDKYREFKDGKKQIEKILPNGTYNILDEKGRVVKAGIATSKGPDLDNYLAYKYDDKTAADGTAIITQIDRVHKGKRETLWAPDKGKEAKLAANGEFTYRTDDGQKVVLRPDQSISKYIKGADKGPDLLSEITYPDGSMRSYKYGEPANPRQPIEIKSVSVAANGDTTSTTLSAMPPVEAEAKPEKPATPSGSAPEKPQPQAIEDLLMSVQLWKMTEEKMSADGAKKETSEVKVGPFFGLEVTSNGDFEATSIGTDNARYLFPARGIAAFPKGIAVPLEGQDGRVLRAQQHFDSVYADHLLPEERKSMKPRQMIAGRLVDTSSIEKDPKLVSVFAREYMTDKNKLNMQLPQLPADLSKISKADLAKIHTDTAYKYELAAAIIEGREALKQRKAKAS